MREGYPYVLEIPTRWADNDIYGHVNNATYYAYFDTAVNRHLIDHGLLLPGESPVVGIVVETMCRFRRSLAFPDTIEAGVQWKKRLPSIPIVKQWIPHVNYRGYYGLDGVWQEGRIHFDLTEVELANGGRFGPEFNVEHQGLLQDGLRTPQHVELGALDVDLETVRRKPLPGTHLVK